VLVFAALGIWPIGDCWWFIARHRVPLWKIVALSVVLFFRPGAPLRHDTGKKKQRSGAISGW